MKASYFVGRKIDEHSSAVLIRLPYDSTEEKGPGNVAITEIKHLNTVYYIHTVKWSVRKKE